MPFIRTSLITTTFEGVELSANGLSFGQQVDEAISKALHAPHTKNGPPPRIHEIAFGFETEEEWQAFMREANKLGYYGSSEA